MLVYIVRNIVNDRLYIGVTRKQTLLERRSKHFYDARRGSDVVFHRAIRKYGPESFEFRELDTADSWDALLRKEIMWIEFFQSLVPHGYNTTKGGEGTLGFAVWSGRHHSDATKLKLSLQHLGMKASDETRRKMSATRTGKPCPWLHGRVLSEEHRRKLSIAGKGRVSSMAGKTHSAETRAKMRAASARRKAAGLPIGGRSIHSDEWKRNHSAKLKAKWAEGAYANRPKHLSEEHKNKIANACWGTPDKRQRMIASLRGRRKSEAA
jgi:group I intron endonuclease